MIFELKLQVSYLILFINY